MGRTLASAHTSQRWRIHEFTEDFRLEDVWSLATPGGPDDFGEVVEFMQSLDLENGSQSPAARALFAIRWKLGALLGWDEPGASPTRPVATLHDRLPADLAATAAVGAEPASSPFTTLYRLDREYAAELANATMHGVLHLGWVADGHGAYRAQMAVLVRPNGRFGRLYMALIKPFRYAIVYPAMLRYVEREWRSRVESQDRSAVQAEPVPVAV